MTLAQELRELGEQQEHDSQESLCKRAALEIERLEALVQRMLDSMQKAAEMSAPFPTAVRHHDPKCEWNQPDVEGQIPRCTCGAAADPTTPTRSD